MSKKGFTLVELLAVIVILGIIGTITVPIVNGILEESRRSAFKSSLNGIKKAIETDYSDNGFNHEVNYIYQKYAGKYQLVVRNSSGSLLRRIDISGQIEGLGEGSVNSAGVITVGIYTNNKKYCGIVTGNTVNMAGEGSYTWAQCKRDVDSIN